MSHSVAGALAALVWGLAAGPTTAQEPHRLIITGGHLFDGTGDTLVPNVGIVIVAGRFLEVGADVSARDLADATVLRLDDGAYIIPGMFDLHAHYAIDLFGQGRIDETTAYPAIFLANGVTSTFPAGEVNPEAMHDLKLRIDRGEQTGPRLFNSGPYFGSWRRGWNGDATVEEIYREVDDWAARGVGGFKAKGISPAHLQALIERAHMHGLTVTGHLDSGWRNSVNPRDAIRMGIDRIEHFLGGDAMPADRSAYASLEHMDIHSPAFDSIVALYLRHHVYFDATLSAYGYFGEKDPAVFTYFDDERKYFTPYMQELLAARPPRPVNEQFERIYRVKRTTVKAFYDAGGGALITLGTDHPSWGEFISGFSVHRELLSFVLSGIPPAAALRFATINGARALGVGDRLGTIEPGKFADLVVIRGNPLEDIRNARRVWRVIKGGMVYDATALRQSVEGTIGPRGPDEVGAWQAR
ncbi:MAG TPA: amidohydrolase family protein [Gemmatimonadales bacterium]